VALRRALQRGVVRELAPAAASDRIEELIDGRSLGLVVDMSERERGEVTIGHRS
jgi:hypothetical protein